MAAARSQWFKILSEIYFDALPISVTTATLSSYYCSLKRNSEDDLVHSLSTPRAIAFGLCVGYTFPISFPLIAASVVYSPRDKTIEDILIDKLSQE